MEGDTDAGCVRADRGRFPSRSWSPRSTLAVLAGLPSPPVVVVPVLAAVWLRAGIARWRKMPRTLLKELVEQACGAQLVVQVGNQRFRWRQIVCSLLARRPARRCTSSCLSSTSTGFATPTGSQAMLAVLPPVVRVASSPAPL